MRNRLPADGNFKQSGYSSFTYYALTYFYTSPHFNYARFSLLL